MMIETLNWIILSYFLVLWVGYIIFLTSSIKGILNKYKQSLNNNFINILVQSHSIPVTVIMPLYNFANKVDFAIEGILNSNYPDIRLIIVNDGSTDNTLEHLIKVYELEKVLPAFKNSLVTAPINCIYQSKKFNQMTVIDKTHYSVISSGADANNAALNICQTPLFMTVDSDTVLDPSAITNMVYCYLTYPHCIAIGGNIYIPDEQTSLNKPIKHQIPRNLNLGAQVVEYLRSFFYGHEGWSSIGGALCHSGACTMFERRAVEEVGGFDRDNYSYDSEIIMKLHHFMRKKGFPYSVAYSSPSIAWASQPDTLIGLWNQRNRWQRGLWRSFFTHIKMLFNPFYGATGLVAFPFYFLFEILGPVVEGVAYILFFLVLITHGVDVNLVFWFIIMAWSYLYLITTSCIFLNYLTYEQYHLKRDLFYLLGITFLELIFYRPFRGIGAVWSTLQYMFNRLLGKCL